MPTLINPTHISAQERGFWYGDGGFTTLRIVDGVPCFWNRHLDRLQELARVLGLQVNWEDLHIAMRLVNQRVHQGVVKIVVSRGVGGRGYLPPEQEATVMIYHWPDESLQLQPEIPLMLPINATVLRLPVGWISPALRGLKTLNRLEQVMLREELQHSQADEGLVFDHQDTLVSGVQSNVFFLKNGRWHTPSLKHAGVAGTLRAELLDRADSAKQIIEISLLKRQQLDQVEALFFCNALRGMQPVGALTGRSLAIQPVYNLHAMLSKIRMS